jgi:MFS family permease
MFYRLFHLNPHDTQHRNAYILVVELFWASILGSAGTFNAAFALRLGATNTDIGLLTSLPALLAVLVSVPAGIFLQRKANRKPWILWSLVINRLGYLLVAAIPLLGGLGIPLGTLTVGIFVAITVPAHFFNIGWIPLIADVIPEEKRASLVTARMMINTITLSIFNFLFGLGLTWLPFPINYIVLYLLGFGASMVSMVYLVQMQVPVSTPVLPQAGEKTLDLQRLRREVQSHPALARIIVNTILHAVGLWLASPLYILYYVRSLGASEDWLGLLGTVSTAVMIGSAPAWRWIMGRWGKPATLKRTIVLAGLFPIGVGLLPHLTPILIAAAINNLIIPGINLSHFTTLLDVTPEDNRPYYTSWYFSIVNIGAFVFPLLSVPLAGWLGLQTTLIVCGVMSCVGSFSFWLWPVQREL